MNHGRGHTKIILFADYSNLMIVLISGGIICRMVLCGMMACNEYGSSGPVLCTRCQRSSCSESNRAKFAPSGASLCRECCGGVSLLLCPGHLMVIDADEAHQSRIRMPGDWTACGPVPAARAQRKDKRGCGWFGVEPGVGVVTG